MRLERFITEERHTPIDFQGLDDDDKVSKMASILFKECKPYLKDLRKSGRVMYRGAYGGAMTKIIPRKNRTPKDMDQHLSDQLDDAFYSHVGWRPRSEGVFTSGDNEQAKGYGDGLYTVWPAGDYKFVYNENVFDLYTHMDSVDDIDNIDTTWMEDEWQNQYGEGQEGSWYYEGRDTEESDNTEAMSVAANWIRDEQEFETEEEEEDFDPYEEMDELDWEPDISLDDYLEDAVENERERLLDSRDEVVYDYSDDNIVRAIDTGYEIMVGCKSYYLIDDDFTNELNVLLKIGKIKPVHKQLKFQFAYKKRRPNRKK